MEYKPIAGPQTSTGSHAETMSRPHKLRTDVAERKFGVDRFEGDTESDKINCVGEIPDMDCGEPMVSQHLRIDFNPLRDVDDNEFLLNKCMSFWKLIEGSKELQELKVLPEKDEQVLSPSVKSLPSNNVHVPSHVRVPPPMPKNVDVMEKNGNIIDDCLIAKMKTRYCEEGSGDYFADLPNSTTGPVTKWSTHSKGLQSRFPTRAQHNEVAKICTEYDESDKKHPKCMVPPNHGPPHTCAVMQRN